jgi:predicted nucleic acid-binding protein
MRCVLDSNIGVKWLLQEEQSDKARIVRNEYSRGLHKLLAPDVFTVECAHALMRAAQVCRRISPFVGHPICAPSHQFRSPKTG